MERKDKKEQLCELWEKYRTVLLILAAGVICLLWPTGQSEAVQTAGAAAEREMEPLSETEERMRRILSRIEGVGKLELMLTLESSAGQTLAADTDLSHREDSGTEGEWSRRTETVIISGKEGDVPVVEYWTGPGFRGALIVCEGAENASVRLAVTQAVAALTGLGSDRIVVIKCQS